MKKVILFLAVFVCFFPLISCVWDEILPRVTPTLASVSANSAVIEWKSVGKKYRYSVTCWETDSQGWWGLVDNEREYYLQDFSNESGYNPPISRANFTGRYNMVYNGTRVLGTSIKLDNLEKSTIYGVFVQTQVTDAGTGYTDKNLFFRTKDE
jgi:hypothetical protein